jgi:hypothetical protein
MHFSNINVQVTKMLAFLKPGGLMNSLEGGKSQKHLTPENDDYMILT